MEIFIEHQKVKFIQGNQTFTLDYEGDKDDLEWMRNQLNIAFENFIREIKIDTINEYTENSIKHVIMNGVESECEKALHKQSVTVKDKDTFENDMAAAILNVLLKHKVITGYKGDFGRWIECETNFKYLYNAGGIYVEDLDFAATESDYHR